MSFRNEFTNIKIWKWSPSLNQGKSNTKAQWELTGKGVKVIVEQAYIIVPTAGTLHRGDVVLGSISRNDNHVTWMVVSKTDASELHLTMECENQSIAEQLRVSISRVWQSKVNNDGKCSLSFEEIIHIMNLPEFPEIVNSVHSILTAKVQYHKS